MLLPLTRNQEPKSQCLPTRTPSLMPNLLREYNMKMGKNSSPAGCLCLITIPSCCWLYLEAAAPLGTAAHVGMQCIFNQDGNDTVADPPCNSVQPLSLGDDFSHGACTLNSREKKNELLIKMCLDSLLHF